MHSNRNIWKVKFPFTNSWCLWDSCVHVILIVPRKLLTALLQLPNFWTFSPLWFSSFTLFLRHNFTELLSDRYFRGRSCFLLFWDLCSLIYLYSKMTFSIRSSTLLSRFSIFTLRFIYFYVCFPLMYRCAPSACLVPGEKRKWFWISLKLEFLIDPLHLCYENMPP